MEGLQQCSSGTSIVSLGIAGVWWWGGAALQEGLWAAELAAAGSRAPAHTARLKQTTTNLQHSPGR